MRIGIDATSLDPETRYTGVGVYTLKLLQHLPELEPSNVYIAYGSAGTDRPPELPDAVDWRPLPSVPLGKLSAAFTQLFQMPGIVARDALDVLHCPTVQARISRSPIPRRVTCPMVVTLHDLIPVSFYGSGRYTYPWRLRTIFRWNLRALKHAQRVITVSETSRRDILSRLNLSPTKVVTIYNGVDRPNRHATPDPPDEGDYILFVGSTEARKNLAGLLSAYSQARDAGLSYRLVAVVESDRDKLAGLEERSAELGLDGSVSFLHSVPDSDLGRLYEGASIFAFPSLAEGFGFPAVQALTYGLPVVASDIEVTREVLGDAALYTAPAESSALADALVELARDDQVRGRLREAGLRRVTRYTWSECCKHTLDVYRQALSGNQ